MQNKMSMLLGASEIGTARILPILSRKQQSHHSIGFVGPHIQVKILDRATKGILGPNAPGEMLIKTPNVMMGYYKNIEASKEAIDPEGINLFNSTDESITKYKNLKK